MHLDGKTGLVIITGASRGIGKEIALQMSKLLSAEGSTFILMARNEPALAELKEIMLRNCEGVRVEVVKIDLSQPSPNVDTIAQKIQQLGEENDYDHRIIIHNAGTVGDMAKKSSELSDEAQWHSYLQTNLVSTIRLNNQIFQAINEAPAFVVNITSLLSIKAFPSFTQYSVGKAAREAYFRAFAVEHPRCRVLSYSPGPVDTDMHSEVCDKSYDETVKQLFSKRYEGESTVNRKLLTSSETVSKFIQILQKNDFQSGTRVDYFDEQ